VRLPEPGRPERLFRAFSLGDLADLFVLDERSHRDRQGRNTAEVEAAARSMLGREQLEWLVGGLVGSTAAWRLIGNTVMIGQVYAACVPDELARTLAAVGVLSRQDFGPEPDQWDGYPREREQLLHRLRESRNVVFLSGDVHTAWAIELKLNPVDPREPPVAVEFITPSVTSENLDEKVDATPRERAEIAKRLGIACPHVRGVDLCGHGWTLVDVTRKRLRAEWHLVDHVRTRAPGERVQASWEVPSGEARIVAAGGPSASVP
jgi:phosphodiesterase/alkaline phosphatase D-like protein